MKKHRFALLATVAVFLAAFAFQSPLSAQDTDAADEAVAEDVVAETEGRSLLELFQLGGLAMYPLLLLSVGGVGLIVYNFIALRPAKILDIETVERVAEKAKAFELDEARAIAEESNSPVSNILSAGLERVSTELFEPEAMEKAMEESSQEELAAPFVYINYLSVVATLSPMVGLLGTVSGMVKAFNAIAAQGVGQPQVLATNISEALVTTATGMIIGIPAMFFYFFFKNRYGRIVSSVSRIVGDFHFEFVSSIRGGSAGR